MAPRSRLFLLGRTFARLAAQKHRFRRDVPVKEMADKETHRFESIVEKRLNEQNLKIARLKNRKDLLEQKLNTELKRYEMNKETQTSKIKLAENSLLLNYMKHGMVVLIFGTGFLAGKFSEVSV